MTELNILFTITSLAPGGAERMILEMVANANPTQLNFDIVSFSDDLRALEVYGHEKIKVHVFNLKRGSPWQLLRFARFLRQKNYDLIHAHMFHALVFSFLGKSLARASGPLCFTSHNYKHKPHRRWIMRFIGRSIKRSVIFIKGQDGFVSPDRAVLIPNAVANIPQKAERRPWDPGRVKFLVIGRLVPQKDCEGLVLSFAKAGLQRAHLNFVGDGPLRAQLEGLVKNLNIVDQVTFWGFSTDTTAHYRSNDVLVIHSHTEGMPMTVLEAGSHGMPVVSTPVGSLPDLLSGGCGTLADREDFANALRDASENSAAYLEMGDHLREKVCQTYGMEKVLAQTHQMYLAAMLNQ